MINTNRAVVVFFTGNANVNQLNTSGPADIYMFHLK